MTPQERRFFAAAFTATASQLDPDGLLVQRVGEEALIATVQFDGKQRMRHGVHDSRGCFFRSTHPTSDANRCTVLPP